MTRQRDWAEAWVRLAETRIAAASVVNLKFLSHGWHARGRNFKFENHTRNINLLVQLLNPKFALRVAPR
jgi:hypothetical protein